jgi:hypothetical protein
VFAKRVSQDGEEFIDVVAGEGASLKLLGSQPITIDATHIHMLGRKTGRTADPFEIVSADAEGSVIAASGATRSRPRRPTSRSRRPAS